MHTVFQSHHIPVVIQLPDGKKFNDPNDSIGPLQDTVDKFIELNVMNENSKHFQDHYRYPSMGFANGRIIQRRRRRGTLKKLK